jgi:hypothetical protein
VGLTLDPVTGEILGAMPFVSNDIVYAFSVRASAGTVFVERSFTLRNVARFASQEIYNISLRLRVAEAKVLLSPYSLIPDEMLYRLDDPSFGRARKPEAYLIGGLDGSVDLEEALRGDPLPASQGRVGNDYHQPLRLVLGQHRFAVARDSTGAVVYEVLFRELYDPMSKAGGFAPQTALVSEEKVVYPQASAFRVFPNSIRNIRNDLVKDVGFAVSDPALQRTLGAGSPELLPLWMRSEQTLGDESSRIGFHLGIPVAYLEPGSSKAVARIIAQNADAFLKSGRIYYFDKYAVSGVQIEIGTAFDGELFVIDGGLTSFDLNIVHSDPVEILKYMS